MITERMLYRRYKASYADCETVAGSYDKEFKTIEVLIPEGRIKPSGVRGQSYHYMTFRGIEKETGREVSCTIKAVCSENAIKRLPENCDWDIG